jgi:hypothetical protein
LLVIGGFGVSFGLLRENPGLVPGLMVPALFALALTGSFAGFRGKAGRPTRKVETVRLFALIYAGIVAVCLVVGLSALVGGTIGKWAADRLSLGDSALEPFFVLFGVAFGVAGGIQTLRTISRRLRSAGDPKGRHAPPS